MDTLDVIKELCSKKGISISQLEDTLGYGNGSIAKSRSMSADRAYQIAQYFNVPMEYLMTGKTVEATENEIALLRQQQSILIQINKINSEITNYYKRISDCQAQLVALKKEYSVLDTKKGDSGTPGDSEASGNQLKLNHQPEDSFFAEIFGDEDPFT